MTDFLSRPEPPPILSVTSRVANWRWWVHLLILAAFPLVIGGMAAFEQDSIESALTGTVSGLLLVCGLELLLFGVVFGAAWAFSRASASELLLNRRLHLRDVPLSLLYSVAIRVGVGMVAAGIGVVLVATGAMTLDQLQDFVAANRPKVEAMVDVNALATNPLYMSLNLTLVSFVVAGLREELWRAGVLAGFRTLWPGVFSSPPGQLLAAAIAAVFFGAGHFSQGVVAVFMTALLGFMLGAIMIFHRSVWPAVLAHGAFNATSFLALPWAMKYMP